MPLPEWPLSEGTHGDRVTNHQASRSEQHKEPPTHQKCLLLFAVKVLQSSEQHRDTRSREQRLMGLVPSHDPKAPLLWESPAHGGGGPREPGLGPGVLPGVPRHPPPWQWGVCKISSGQTVLLSHDKGLWGLPNGHPAGCCSQAFRERTVLWFVGAHGRPAGLILEANKQSGKPNYLARCLNTVFVGVLHRGSTSGPPRLEHWAEQITVLYPLPLGFMFPSMKSTLAFLSLRLTLLTCRQTQEHKVSSIQDPGGCVCIFNTSMLAPCQVSDKKGGWPRVTRAELTPGNAQQALPGSQHCNS